MNKGSLPTHAYSSYLIQSSNAGLLPTSLSKGRRLGMLQWEHIAHLTLDRQGNDLMIGGRGATA